MTGVLFNNILRFVILWLLQILILQRFAMGWEGYSYINVIIYPLYVLLLPISTDRVTELTSAFFLGILVDIFYDSLGIHASAMVFTAFVRPLILSRLKPRGGYKVNASPTIQQMGTAWFFRYASILMAIHLFFYFSVEAFTFAFIGIIVLKTFFTFIFSMIFVMAIMIIFNPKE